VELEIRHARPASHGLPPVSHTQEALRLSLPIPMRFKFMKPDAKPKPVNDIADLRKNAWSGLAKRPQWRCLIPVSDFVEAEGPDGRKTRTWFRMKDQPLFAWAALWRVSDDWGGVYSGVMTDCNNAIRPVHNRMPVLVQQDEWDLWLNDSFENCCAFQDRTFPAELIEMERTDEFWSRNSKAAKAKAEADAKAGTTGMLSF
jgi:putative SOS response-associated peptidase YedK